MKRMCFWGLMAAIALVSVLSAMERHGDDCAATRYGSQPKGLTMEGIGQGIEPVKTIAYDAKTNQFIFNEKYYYTSPLVMEELRTLTEALVRDDRVGVSLNALHETIAYGGLRHAARSDLVQKMMAGDRILGGVVFGRKDLLGDVKLPDDFKPKVPAKRSVRDIVYGNMSTFVFEPQKNDATGTVTYIGRMPQITLYLIRVSDQKAPDGGFLPETDPVLAAQLQPEDEDNLQHLENNKGLYFSLPQLAYTIKVGEAAAFLRFVRESGCDLAALAKSMR